MQRSTLVEDPSVSGTGRQAARAAGLALVALAAGALFLAGCGSSGHKAATSTSAPSTTAAPTSSSASTAVSTTSTPTTAPSPSTTSTTVAATASGSSSCIVGSWTTTTYTQQVEGATATGGAGIHVAITPSKFSADFTGMQPLTFSSSGITGQGIFKGQEQAGIVIAASTAGAGTFTIPAPGTSNVTFEAKIGSGSYSAPIPANSFQQGGFHATWTCSSSTMSMTVGTPDGPTTWVMSRA